MDVKGGEVTNPHLRKAAGEIWKELSGAVAEMRSRAEAIQSYRRLIAQQHKRAREAWDALEQMGVTSKEAAAWCAEAWPNAVAVVGAAGAWDEEEAQAILLRFDNPQEIADLGSPA